MLALQRFHDFGTANLDAKQLIIKFADGDRANAPISASSLTNYGELVITIS
jgi:hypothetical protein